MRISTLFFAALILLRTVSMPTVFAMQTHAFDFCQLPLSDGANYEELRDKIEHCHITSIDTLMPLLSKAHLSQYVLMHHSQSLQEASTDSPRAILYGKDAKLILAFNGNPKQLGHDHLEVLQYRGSNHSFEMREIIFQGKVQFSVANPTLCLSCHQSDPRPNWESYPLWPGAYGGEDDSVFRSKDASKVKTEDGVNYHRFQSQFKNKGRYRFLALRPKPALPNTEFGSLLQKLNQIRLARKIAENKILLPYRYALIGASACYYSDTELNSFVPDRILKKFKKSLLDFRIETAQTNHANFGNRVQSLKEMLIKAPEEPRIKEMVDNFETPPGSNGQVSDQIVAGLRFLIENQGEDTTDWGMQPESLSYDFENGYVGISDLNVALKSALLTSHEQLKFNSLELNQACAWLKSMSIRALGGQ